MRYLTFLFVILLLASCGSDENTNQKDDFSYLPDAVGGYSTINIIADESLWDYGLKSAIEPAFSKEIEGLLNAEREFDITTVRSKAFNRLFQRQRFIVIFVTGKKVMQEGVSVKNNVYANGQIIVQVAAKTDEAVYALFKEKQQDVFQLLDNHRTKIIQNLAAKENNKKLEKTLANNHGIKLTIPKSYKLAADSTNFFYATKKAEMKCEKFDHDKCYIQTGIFTYFFNYTSQEVFTPEKFIAMRDSVTKIYIEGNSTNDSLKAYMQVYKGLPVSTENLNLNGKFGYEVKGWWDLKNGTMGGPFVSVAFVDEARSRVIVTDAFIYGPNFNKRRFIKELEAICLSAKAL